MVLQQLDIYRPEETNKKLETSYFIKQLNKKEYI